MNFRHFMAAAVLLAVGGSGCDSGTDPLPPSIAVSPASATFAIAQGRVATYPITLSRTNFAGTVDLAVDSLPDGVTGSFSPASLSGGATMSTLTLAATNTAVPGVATARITATGAGLSTLKLPLSLRVDEGGRFTLAVAPMMIDVPAGGSGTVAVSIVRTGAFTGEVTLSTAPLPAGITVKFNPPSTSGSSASLTLTGANTVPAGYPRVTVRATAPGLPEQAATVTLQVSAATGF